MSHKDYYDNPVQLSCECDNCTKGNGKHCNGFIVYCDICKFHIVKKFNKCHNCPAKICTRCLEVGHFLSCNLCRYISCYACHTTSILQRGCKLNVFLRDIQQKFTICAYCNKEKVHVVHIFTECVYKKPMCCICLGSIPKLKREIADVNEIINHILCDPSRIVSEYWAEDFENNQVIFAKDIDKCKDGDNFRYCAWCCRKMCIIHNKEINNAPKNSLCLHDKCVELYKKHYFGTVVPSCSAKFCTICKRT
jgi:hypothetical protein